MEKAEIKVARRFADSYVAEEDIVDIRMSYIQDRELYSKLGSTSNVTGRIVSFEDYCIVLDMSTLYKSKQVDIPYCNIVTIKPHVKEEANHEQM